MFNIPASPALEAVLYGNLKLNTCMKGQEHLRLPKSSANEVIMITPSADITYKIINSEYPTFYRDGFRAYVTETKINRKMGAKQIKIVGYSEFRKNYIENVKNRAIKFHSEVQVNEIESNGSSFIFDTGKMHELYFSNRYTNRSPDYICADYMKFLLDRIDAVAPHFKKILYIPINEWILATGPIGTAKEMLKDPVSIIMKCMLKFPNYIQELKSRECTILFVNDESGEVLKFEFPIDPKDPNKLKDIGSSDIKQLYAKLKTQLSRFDLPTGSITKVDVDEDTPTSAKSLEDSDDTPVPRAVAITNNTAAEIEKKCPVAMDVKRELIEDGSVLDTVGAIGSTDFDDSDDETSESTAEIDDISAEISDVIDAAVNEIPELTDDSVPDTEKKTILENEVKKKVFINNFVPEKTKKQMEYIEVGQAKQSKILTQSIDQMKSKIIDETIIDDDVVETNNTVLKHIKYANADKSYVEKKYIPDINNAVAKLADTDVKVFIESIEEVDSSDQLNQKKTLTYHLVDENGRKHTLCFDVPIIRDGCHMYLGGANKMLLHQRIFKPIVKIRPDVVQLVTFYNKVTVSRYGKSTTPEVSSLKKYFTKHSEKYRVKFGNANAKNQKYKTSIEFDDFARSFTKLEFVDGSNSTTIFFDLSMAEEEYFKTHNHTKHNPFTTDNPPCLLIKRGNERHMMSLPEGMGMADFIFTKLGDAKRNAIMGNQKGGKFVFARAKILNDNIPVALFCMFCEGFTTVMRKCKIPFEIISTIKEIDTVASKFTKYSAIKIADGVIVYEAAPMANALFMNGLKGIGLDAYTREELDSKDTYIDLISNFYASANQAYNLDNFRMFLIDNKTKEILEDFDLPTDLIEIMFYTCQLLSTNQYLADNDMHNMRIRSNEIIPQIAYEYVVQAYSRFYKTQNNKHPEKISMPKDCVIKALMSSSLLDEDSVVNPIYQLEKSRACTISASTSAKGITLTGINKVDGYGMDKRAYDPTMLGVFGLTSPADANVGIVRDLALEPSITSTNGYIDISSEEDVEGLHAANLFTGVELLTPPGVLHDDPQRSAMMRGQTSKMVMVDQSQPVLMGNKVESIIPYHLNNDYCFTAKDAGTVIDEKDGVFVVQYKNGTYDSFDTREAVKKNAADGSYTKIKFESKVQVGSKFKKNEVLAVEPAAFSFNKFDRGASCNIGVLCKVAIVSLYDTFEDSEPISSALSKKLGFYSIKKKSVSFDATTYIEKIAKIGDHVNIGDALVTFDSSRGDPEIQQYLDNLRKGMEDSGIIEDIIEANNTVVKAPTTGEISDIKIYSTVPVEQLSPSLQKIVKGYHRRIESTEKFLDKYRNPGDNKYYKCGHLFSETTDVVETKFGKVKGESVGDGVLIEFYIKHHDIVKKGDKVTEKK